MSPLRRCGDGLIQPPVCTALCRSILQTVPSPHIAHDGKLGAVRRPIGPLDVLEHFTRSTADQGHARESSAETCDLICRLPSNRAVSPVEEMPRISAPATPTGGPQECPPAW